MRRVLGQREIYSAAQEAALTPPQRHFAIVNAVMEWRDRLGMKA